MCTIQHVRSGNMRQKLWMDIGRHLAVIWQILMSHILFVPVTISLTLLYSWMSSEHRSAYTLQCYNTIIITNLIVEISLFFITLTIKCLQISIAEMLCGVQICCHQCLDMLSSMFANVAINVWICCHQCLDMLSSMFANVVINVWICCHQCLNILSSMFANVVINVCLCCHQCLCYQCLPMLSSICLCRHQCLSMLSSMCLCCHQCLPILSSMCLCYQCAYVIINVCLCYHRCVYVVINVCLCCY